MDEVLKSLIERGYDEGIVEIIDDDNDILFRIGECEFYLTEKGIENMTAAEYVANTPKQDIVRKVCEAFAYVHGIYDTEYCYYVLYLLEHIGTDEDIDILRDLLVDKATKEQEQWVSELLQKTPQEIANSAYEHVVRGNFVDVLEDIDDVQSIVVLLAQNEPLKCCYDLWVKSGIDNTNGYFFMINDVANEIMGDLCI